MLQLTITNEAAANQIVLAKLAPQMLNVTCEMIDGVSGGGD